MARVCLPKALTSKFLGALKSGELDPAKLSELSSVDRHAEFAKVIGEGNAKEVNALFESKLLLKNQQQGILNWAKKVGGLKPDAARDLATRVAKMDKLLNPVDERHFLEDLASKRLGTDVTAEEAKKIASLSKDIQDTKATMESAPRRENGKAATATEMAHGRAKVAFGNYVSDLKNSNAPGFVERLKTNPVGLAGELPGLSKGLKASLDNSAIFRQGWKTLFTHPGVWLKNARQSFVDLVKQFGGKQVMDEVQADIQSRPTYDLMQKAKLDVGTTEEQFPSHLAEKVPLLGRAYKASEAAYTGFVYRTRADLFDKYIKIAQTAGIDVTDKAELESIGKLVNSLTGRGHLGALGEKAAGVVNSVFFSPRFLKSNLDFLTAHQLQKGVTPFVRKQAALNLVKVIAGSATILGIANAIKPGSVEFDPRSSNFGKIKIGSTTFDVSGGMGSILTLAARLATFSSKSSLTGKINPLNSGKYGAQTGMDVLTNFGEGKLSPIAGIVRDILEGQDFNYNKPTPLNEVNNLLTPLPISNAQQLFQTPNGANPLAGIIADALGISVNTLSKPKKK